MNPKEKAWQLINQCSSFYRDGIHNVLYEDIAKQYALMIAEEVLKIPYLLKKETWFYKQVIKEIKNL